MPYLSEAPLIFWQRWYTGWITLRNQLTTPIRLMGRRVIELYDSLLSGNDLEITTRLTLQRRPGYLPYCTSGILNGTLLNTYTWKTASQGVFQIFDTTVDVEYIAPGAISHTVIFTKPAGSSGNKAYMFGVGNYLFVSGKGFAFKWDGPTGRQGVTNWGISLTQTSFGPTTATTGVNNSSLATGTAWANPTGVTGISGFASAPLTTGSQTEVLQCSGFGFSVTAGDVITGIQVTANVQNPTGCFLSFGLYFNGGTIGFPKYANQLATPTAISFGSGNDLWGAPYINPAWINSSSFSIIIFAQGTSGVGTRFVEVNDVVVTIFSGGPLSGTPTCSGSFSAINGFSYVMAYGNSISGEVSNATTVGPNTGPFSGAAYVAVPVTASTDTQVDQIHVYRTTDSGGGSIFYELPNSPFANANATIQDTALDTALQVNSQAATNFQNTPPPANLIAMEWFAGRLWGVVGNLLYFSTGPDSLSGLQQSNWNPIYVFVIPTSITRLTALPNGMLIHDLDEILVARGTSTTSFTINEFMRDTGLWNYNAADTDGSNVYMFTADREFYALTASGLEEVGGGVIADQLQTVDPTQAYVTIYRSGLDAMVFLLDVVNQVLYPFNTRQNAWCLPALPKFSNMTAAGAMEIKPGIWKYLIGTGDSIAQRDLNTFTDLGATYAPQVVIGTIQEADPGTLAKMENVYLELTNAGSVPSVSILPNDAGVTLTNPIASQIITAKFLQLTNPVADPPTYGNTPVSYRSLRYNWQSIAPQIYNPASAAAVKYVQILIQFASENAQNEVLGLGLSGKQQGDVQTAGQLPQLQGH